MVNIFLADTALRDLKKLPRVISKRIFLKLEEFQENPISTKNLKKLAGQPLYRIRVGDYRIILEYGKKKENYMC